MSTPDDFLAHLDDAERTDLMSRGVTRPVASGSFLMNEGQSADHVLVILEGRVKVSSFTADGREVVLAVREPGGLLGELSALDGGERSASVAALEPVKALIVPADRFESYLTDHPRLALLLLRMTIRRLRDADRKRVEFGAFDTAGRVARRLVELVDRYGVEGEDGVSINLALSQETLAGWTASSREAVSKALRELRDQGWIRTSRKRIVVLDPEALRDRAR